MVGIFLAYLLLLGVSSVQEAPGEIPVSSFLVEDTIRVDIFTAGDNAGSFTGYRARVTTPVCEPDKCYIIELDISWDLVGRYSGYDTIPGKGLTKLDHIPFTPEDYNDLHRILRNRSSPLSLYRKNELVQNTRRSKLDGITGATLPQIKESVVDGAVYSCFTLWHIVHGEAGDSIRESTLRSRNDRMIGGLLDKKDMEINYFLVDHLTEEEFRQHLIPILHTINEGEGYYAKHTLEKLPSSILGEPAAVDFFITWFAQWDYFTQVALLEKLDPKSVNEPLRNILESQMTPRNSYKNQLIRDLLD